jgi:hypothetical protein
MMYGGIDLHSNNSVSAIAGTAWCGSATSAANFDADSN